MSKAKITKPFKYAIGGTQVVEIPPGTYGIGDVYVEGKTITARMVECAVERGVCSAPKRGKAAAADELALDSEPAGDGDSGDGDSGDGGDA